MSLPISVQVCTLNEEQNIAHCLNAIGANVTEEILVIDGGSTDNTVRVATDLGARVLAPGRLGLGPSRRLGYMSTACKYVAFVDADDRLPAGWLESMLEEMESGGYAALQSSVRAANADGFWGSGWNEYFTESIRSLADTNMVGRPALFRRDALTETDGELESLDEDTHLSRRFELQGLRQGISQVVAYRCVETTWRENHRKWRSYGRGYRGFVGAHPERIGAIRKHMFITIPLTRGFRPVLRGRITQPFFAALMAGSILRGWYEAR